MMANTAVVSIDCPYASYSGNFRYLAVLRVMPPRAACTVAFGIQAKAMKARSEFVYFAEQPHMKVAPHRARPAIKMTPNPYPISDG